MHPETSLDPRNRDTVAAMYRGKHPDPTPPRTLDHWTPARPPLAGPTTLLRWVNSKPERSDLTGTQRGHLAVIGLAQSSANEDRSANQSEQWVVRCVCGMFRLARQSYVKRGKDHCCPACLWREDKSRKLNATSKP